MTGKLTGDELKPLIPAKTITVKSYLDRLWAIASGTVVDDDAFRKMLLKQKTPLPIFEQKMKSRRRAIKKFMDHHMCTGVFNGSPVWRRLPSYYNIGKKY